MTDLAVERDALTLFELLLDVPESDHDGWVADRTEGRPHLRERLNAIRTAWRRHILPTGGAVDQVEEEPAPDRIGAYAIGDLIGRGGMGSVYRAERAAGDFTHVAAVKIIKPGLLSDTLVERFQRERQTLAGLSHPNIARLYDGGETTAGSPYIIMEHVDGLPLLRWLDENPCDRDARIRLFRDICAAVAFANRNLIVHRDVTPANVLVTRDGVVKLIDFGISRAVEAGDLRGDTGGEVLSHTPGYAAPERLLSTEVSTAADIFSLGRLLEDLLEPTPRERELNAIVRKATAADPAARYASADALAADVVAWRSGHPVSAVGSDRSYQIRKFIGRHRLASAAAAGFVIMLTAALGVTLNAYAGAQAARREEAARFQELRSLAHFMLFELNNRMERVVGNTEARATLAGRAQHYLSALAASPGADDALRLEAAQGFIALARSQGVPAQPNLGQAEQAKANIQTALRMLAELDGRGVGVDAPMVEALASLAMIQAHTGADVDAANATLGKAERRLASKPAERRDAAWHAARRNLRRAQLELTTLMNKPDEMLRLANLLEAEIRQWPEDMQRTRMADIDRAYAAHFRGLRGYFQDDLDGGMAEINAAASILNRLDREASNDPVVLYATAWNAYVGYGLASGGEAFQRDAERFLRQANETSERLMRIEANDSAIKSFAANVRQIQSQALSAEGRHADAATMQADVIALYRAGLTAERAPTLLSRLTTAHFTMGNIARDGGRKALACDHYRQSLELVRELAGRNELFGYVATLRPDIEAEVRRCPGAS